MAINQAGKTNADTGKLNEVVVLGTQLRDLFADL